jgi:hypothetical protein
MPVNTLHAIETTVFFDEFEHGCILYQ